MVTYGIDLGTTYTKVAYISPEAGAQVMTVPMGMEHLLPGHQAPGLRSAVALWTDREGRPMACVGEEARGRSHYPGLRVLEESKARIGLGVQDVDGFQDAEAPPWRVEGQPRLEYRPEDIAALILRQTKSVVDRLVPQHPMQNVVITFPQRFEEVRRAATRCAGDLAGLNVVGTLTEPDAVCWLFGVENQLPGVSLIFDIGGGTTDVNVVRYQDGGMEVLGSHGVHVAGRHFDHTLLSRVILPACYQASDGRFTDVLLKSSPRETAAFMKLAEQLKIRLSGAAGNDVPVELHIESDLLGDRLQFDIRRTRAQVGEFVQSNVDACRRAAESAMAAAQTKIPGLAWSDLRAVFLVGGSSGLVWIRDMLRALTGKEPMVALNPSSAIAEGAAYYTQSLAARQGHRELVMHARPDERRKPTMIQADHADVKTVMQRGLGLVAYDAPRQIWYVETLVAANTALPTRYERRFSTVEAGQREIFLEFMEGDSPSLDDCTSAAECVIPVPSFDVGERLRVNVDIDLGGRKEIIVVREKTGERYPAHLSFPAEVVVPEADVPQRRAYLSEVMLTERLPT